MAEEKGARGGRGAGARLRLSSHAHANMTTSQATTLPRCKAVVCQLSYATACSVSIWGWKMDATCERLYSNQANRGG